MNNRRLEKTAPSVLLMNLSPNSIVYSCLAAENQLTVTLVKEEKFDSRGRTVLRKHQVVCNGAKIESLKKYLSLLEYFQLYHVYERENAKNESNLFTYAEVSVPVQVPLNDENLPEDIWHLIEQGCVDSVTYYGMEYGLKASYTVAYKRGQKLSLYNL